jgi:hypothetical protein
VKISQKPFCAVCQVCFDDNRVPLKKAVVCTKEWSPANLTEHMQTQHTKEDVAAYWDKVEEKNQAIPVRKDRAVTELFFGNNGVRAGTQTTIVNVKAEQVIQTCNTLLYKFFNSANISINQAPNIHLNKLLQEIVTNGPTLKFHRSKVCFTRWRYKQEEIRAFNKFTNFVTTSIEQTRKYYLENTGKHVPFLSVAHDGWDSKRRDVLGVSIHFVSPIHWKTIKLLVGLKHLVSKKASSVTTQINKILARYVFCKL